MAQSRSASKEHSADSPLASLRDWAGRNEATERLMKEAEEYLQSRAKELLGSMSDKIMGAAEASGSPGAAAVKSGLSKLQEGGSPVSVGAKVLGTSAKEAAKSILSPGSGSKKASLFAEALDIGVSVTTAYNQWTQFQEFARFMKGIEGVEQQDEVQTTWRVKIGPSRRTWKGSIREQIPDRRIAWSSEGAKGSTQGVITFHPLADDLTRMLVSIEYYPQGFVEHVGNFFRWQGRRVHLDLMNFRRFIMSQGEETGQWRGEIREGKVVRQTRDGDRQSADSRDGSTDSRDGSDDDGGARDTDDDSDSRDTDEDGSGGDVGRRGRTTRS